MCETWKFGSLLKIVLLLLLLLGFISSACSLTNLRTPQNRFESPEVTGQTASAAFTLHSSGRIDFAPNHSSPSNPTIMDENESFPARPNNPDFWENLIWIGGSIFTVLRSMGLEGRMDVDDHLELYLNTRYEAAAMRGKYQFLGEPASHARAGNFSMALDMGFGTMDVIQDLTNRYTYQTIDAALITGYRTTDTLLLYGGSYYSLNHSSSPAAEAVDVMQQGVNFGLRYQFHPHASLSFEIARSQLDAAATHYLKTHYGLQLKYNKF